MLEQKKLSITQNFPGSPKKTEGELQEQSLSWIFCQLDEESHRASEHSILLFTPSECLLIFACLIWNNTIHLFKYILWAI